MFKPLKQRLAFTLIEIISVIALSSLIFILIYQIYDVSQKVFNQSNTTLELAQNGRVILDRLSRELRQAKVIATPLPIDKNQNGFAAPNFLLFENGHDATTTQYLRYELQDHKIHRQIISYSFDPNPEIPVHYNDVDQFGTSPTETILEDRIIAEYVEQIIFYGAKEITIELSLKKNNYFYYLLTTIWGRNTLYGQG